MPVAESAFHWQPVLEHEKDAVRTLAIRHARPSAAKAVGVFMLRQERLHQRPKLIADRKACARTLKYAWLGAVSAA